MPREPGALPERRRNPGAIGTLTGWCEPSEPMPPADIGQVYGEPNGRATPASGAR